MSRDIHRAPFDEGTKAKLSIFQDYLREWLPVFLKRKDIIWTTINIFDFFAGPGSDSRDVKGTPLIIIDELEPYKETIETKKLNVNLYFNEYDKSKNDKLKSKIDSLNGQLSQYKIDIESLDFKEAFEKQVPKMENKNCVNLLFLDQNGVKHISEDVFKKIISFKQTDFLFFTSSSTIKRFADHPNIAQHIKLNPDEVEKTPYYKIHRLILDYYKSLIPKNKEYYLAPFSVRKNSGVYGLIFGSGHVLGIQKFLKTCWSIDTERGEANFDIDDDRITPGQIGLFTGEVAKPKKVDLFERELQEKVLKKELKNDKDVYLFTITNGFTEVHSRKVINKLIQDKKILKCSLTLNSTVCKATSQVTNITVN
jgi:three-Cys-motif partner protein